MLDYCHTTDSLRAPRARKFIYFRGKTVGDFANNNASGFHVWCEHRTPIISNDGRSPRTTAATSLERHCDFKRDCSIDILLKCRNFDFNAEKSGCGMQADIGFEKYGDYAFCFSFLWFFIRYIERQVFGIYDYNWIKQLRLRVLFL